MSALVQACLAFLFIGGPSVVCLLVVPRARKAFGWVEKTDRS